MAAIIRIISTFPPDTLGSLERFTTEGWLHPVVNPYNYSGDRSESPEAWAFAVMMQAAWKERVVRNKTVVEEEQKEQREQQQEQEHEERTGREGWMGGIG